ncbi:metallophosphoesterase [Pedobacter heparinus]|uniref:metallophosphoesterase family protein n=1 Tax=Pedobacter heparinus TaxID=984 RepID=UPI00292EDA73|nr:metallophosphoesterase [Pedobacter heparinus]
MKISKPFKAILLVLAFSITTSFTWPKEGHEAAPDINSPDHALKIMVISDLNASYGALNYSPDITAVINRVKTINPDIILCCGDMVAGQKASLTAAHIDSMWNAFNQTVLKPISDLKIPFGFTLGNHDASPGFLKDRAAAKQFWAKQLNATHLDFADNTHYPFYFSYVKNNVFFISWDAASAKIRPEVMDWMKEQLKSKVARNAGFRILLGHLPLYAIVADKNKPGEVNESADQTLNFFKENGIDMYISGHQHAYFPAHKNGILLFNAGCIGNGPRPILGHQEPAKKAYSIIEIPVRMPKNLTFNTFMPETNMPITLSNLPDSVTGFNGVIKKIGIR